MSIQVRIISPQEEEIKEIPMSDSERERFLYQHLNGQQIDTNINPQSNMTADEIFRQWEMEAMKQSLPKANPITINNPNINQSKWTDLDLGNGESLSIKINIVSDF